MTHVEHQHTEPTIGTEWDVHALGLDRWGRRRGDGDTCWPMRSRIDRLGDKRYRVADLEPVSVRLVWLDSPERGQPGWAQARDDLTAWLDAALAMGCLRVLIYDGGAGWDRLLGDFINAAGESASVHMMTEKGWPPYVG